MHMQCVQEVIHAYNAICTIRLQFAFIYFFNLHFGQSILVLPRVFSKTGLVLSALVVTAVAGVNCITTFYMVEAMAITNACFRFESKRKTGLVNVRKFSDQEVSYGHVHMC